MKPSPHPVLALPTAAEAMCMGSEDFARFIADREEAIAAERADPYANGWEPPIWKVCDAILGFPWVDPDWAERMRRLLGFERPASVLLINGGQRGSKSEYAGKRVVRVLRLQPESRAWAFHSNLRMSIDYQQPIFWKFMPVHLKKKIQSPTTYIAYKKQTGFSDQKFILDTLSDCVFKTYEQAQLGVEGANLDIIWPDELIPPDLVETLELRIAEKNGRMPITFTPVSGYSETVRLFQDGAQVTRHSTAFLCPKDGGPPDEARALGLTEDELAQIKTAARTKQAALFPQSRPENCELWLEGQTGQPAVPAGREFERVPRVMRCVSKTDLLRAVVFFHSSDNPYGNPKNIWATIGSKSNAFIKERFYGVAHKTYSAQFPKFHLDVHTVAPEGIPTEGTRYHLADPHGFGRNFFMLWIRAAADNTHWVEREWPGSDFIPGIGVPGPWALPDGKLKDGAPGPGQEGFGFGYLRYKEEIARLEAWRDYTEGATDAQIEAWSEYHGAEEEIAARLIDSRFASTPKPEGDRPVTLLESLADIGLNFRPAPGTPIEDGIKAINNALDYDETKPVDYFNRPRLRISSACKNTIYALQTWTGQDGQKGACKEPVDCLRWYFGDECDYRAQALADPTESQGHW